MKRNIVDWLIILCTFFCTVAALGVVGGFQLGHMDFAGFFIGEGICIALIALLAGIHHVFSYQRKRFAQAVTYAKAMKHHNCPCHVKKKVHSARRGATASVSCRFTKVRKEKKAG